MLIGIVIEKWELACFSVHADLYKMTGRTTAVKWTSVQVFASALYSVVKFYTQLLISQSGNLFQTADTSK